MARNQFKRIYDLYVSDLSFQEIEKLIRRDAGEVYEYFAHDIPKPDENRNKFSRSLIFLKSLFNAFLMKLSPARRIFYIAAFVFFVVGISQLQISYIILSFLVVNVLLAFELADKLIVKDDLKLARKIQSELLPQHKVEVPAYSVAALYESASEVGGDYYDIIKINNNKNLLVVGDISGKGLAAALYMVRLQTIVQFLAETNDSPREIVIKLNNIFSSRLSKGYFLTLILACIDENGEINLVRAGHTPVLHFKVKDNSFTEYTPGGLGIGLNNGPIFEKSVEQINIKPEKGDILFFYTDGITESMNEFKGQFGIKYIKRIIEDSHTQDVEVIKSKIKAALSEFMGQASEQDDITFLVFKAD